MSSLNYSHFCFQVLDLIISLCQTEQLCIPQSTLPHVDDYRYLRKSALLTFFLMSSKS